MKSVYEGPQGISLELDPSQIFPDDPGSGTPAIVLLKARGREWTGTFWCVAETGYVDDAIPLDPDQRRWIDLMEVEVDRMYATAQSGD